MGIQGAHVILGECPWDRKVAMGPEPLWALGPFGPMCSLDTWELEKPGALWVHGAPESFPRGLLV